MSGGGIEAVLAEHVIESVGGGTATGSRWRCRCGDTEVVPGTRDYAAHRGTAHVAAQVLAWLDARLAEGDVVEAVARKVRDELRIGPVMPNTLSILAHGGETSLTGTEADVAATAALSAVREVAHA